MRPRRLVPLALAGLTAFAFYVAVVFARAPEAAPSSGPDFVRQEGAAPLLRLRPVLPR